MDAKRLHRPPSGKLVVYGMGELRLSRVCATRTSTGTVCESGPFSAASDNQSIKSKHPSASAGDRRFRRGRQAACRVLPGCLQG